MKTTELIAQHILEVHEGDNWTDSAIAAALVDVSVDDAIRQTAASVNTIASLLHHITFWNRLMIQRINGIDVPETESNGYIHYHLGQMVILKQLIHAEK